MVGLQKLVSFTFLVPLLSEVDFKAKPYIKQELIL